MNDMNTHDENTTMTIDVITFDDVANDDNETFDVVNVARALSIDCKRARARMRANERNDNDDTRIDVHRINNVHTYVRDEFDDVLRIVTNHK